MKIGRNLIILTIAALLAGGAAVYLANRYISSRVASAEEAIRARYELVEVVVPGRDLEAGAQLSYRNMAVREIPKAFLNENAITPATFSAVSGRQLAVPVEAGTPLLRAQVSDYSSGAFSARVEDEKRALTVPVNTTSSVGGLLSPGDRIDLLLTASTNNQEPATVPLLTDVKVLATGQNYLGANDQGYRDVTLEVSARNASRLLLAQRVGTISTTLRGPNGAGGVYKNPVTPENLFKGRYAQLFGTPPEPEPEPTPEPPPPPPPPINLIIGNPG